MDQGNPVYFNFNSTYDNLYDDTFIELDTNHGIRPSATAVLLNDYNSFYINIDRQGFFRVDLDRGWVDSGIAVALPPRPADSVAINNFVAEVEMSSPIAAGVPNELAARNFAFAPQVQAQGGPFVTYEISIDDGITWQEIQLGELQQLIDEDYRLQFRITMMPDGNSTPVIKTYSLEYGGYPDVGLINNLTDFEVTVTPNTFQTGNNFTITVRALDTLGLGVVNYNAPIDLALRNTASENHTSSLSLGQMTLVNGVAQTTSAFITRADTYTLSVSNSDATGESGQFVVTPTTTGGGGDPDPGESGGSGESGSGSNSNSGSSSHSDDSNNPKLSFSSDDYQVCSGQPFTLKWNSVHMTSATLNGEGIGTDGTKTLSINQTTEFSLYANGPKGSLTSKLSVTVDSNPETCAYSSPIFSPVITTDEFGNVIATYNMPGLLTDQDQSETGPGSAAEDSQTDQKAGSGPSLRAVDSMVKIEGERVTLWWETEEGAAVTISTLGGQSGHSGSFQFIARESQTIVITAYKDGKTTTQTVELTVKKLPGNLGAVIPAALLPILAAGIRYAPLSWLLLLGVIKLLGFFKRKPDEDEVELSWSSWLIKQFQVFLWVISPLVLLLSLFAASVLGGAWMIGIAVLCVLITLRHLVIWVRSE